MIIVMKIAVATAVDFQFDVHEEQDCAAVTRKLPEQQWI